ncbi:hypothetical protein K503DRAFT_780631 [Rhizopogon vinicolor AM-OR11-026]|uniref:Uncharacterized protein n=1 Tax=Rhizopogon vinicolor AM-OR11-026 TaxID=1314800 RepID=A0A1B7N9G3_9AGAM|nr:hypothetical protein K503DRAFT_780631 [Rhizopogon vinicolor AM-OR11-026]
MSAERASSLGHNVDTQSQSGSGSEFAPINGASPSPGDRPPDSGLSLHKVIIVLALCVGFGSVGTFCCVIVGHGILQPHMSGFYVSIHSTAKAGAVGGAIVNGFLVLPLMISFAASRPAMTSPICLALLIVGYSATVASSCAGVAILRHIPGMQMILSWCKCITLNDTLMSAVVHVFDRLLRRYDVHIVMPGYLLEFGWVVDASVGRSP